MRYRIKIITYANGRKIFIPQVKTKLFWLGLNYNGGVESGYTMDDRGYALQAIDLHVAGNNKKVTIEFEYINK